MYWMLRMSLVRAKYFTGFGSGSSSNGGCSGQWLGPVQGHLPLTGDGRTPSDAPIAAYGL